MQDDISGYCLSSAGEMTTGDKSLSPWKVLIVDDDDEVHHVTRIVLGGLTFGGRGVDFLGAHSGVEAREVFEHHDDIAVALVDVVMEREDAGLRTVQYVRECLNNPWVRLILRTGQQWAAPEREIVLRYDINDYKSKHELSSLRLFTSVVTALRSYRDIIELERLRRANAEMVTAVMDLMRARSIVEFSEVALARLRNLLDPWPRKARRGHWGAMFMDGQYILHPRARILATNGIYVGFGEGLERLGEPHLWAAMRVKTFLVQGSVLAVRICTRGLRSTSYIVLADAGRDIGPEEKSLIEFFRLKACEALESLLCAKVRESQLKMSYGAPMQISPKSAGN